MYVNSKNGIWLIGGGVSNFDIQKIKQNYHLVVVSMPQTPVIAEENTINESYWYYGNSTNKKQPTIEFLKADYLANYVERAIKVLKYLDKQKWVDNSKLIVAGHSQVQKLQLILLKTTKK